MWRCAKSLAGRPKSWLQKLALTLVVVSGSLSFGCGSTQALPPLAFETPHFRYYADADRGICDGLGDWLEHHYASVGGTLGATLPDGAKFEIFVFANRTELSENGCRALGFAAGGCADGLSVYQLDPVEPHEMVHAYASLLGDPPTFFAEGLALVYGCAGQAPSDPIEPSTDAVWTALLADDFAALTAEEREAGYAAAASFTRFLIDRHGLDAFLDYYAQAKPHASRAAIRDEFARAFDAELDEELLAWEAHPVRTYLGLCNRVAECSTAPIETTGEEVELSPSCSYGESTLGLLPHSSIRRLSAEGRLATRVRLSTSIAVVSQLSGCESRLEPLPSHQASSAETPITTELWTELDAGEYWLLVGADEPDFMATASAEASFSAAECGAAVVRPLAEDTSTIVLTRPRAPDSTGSDPHYIRFELPSTQNATFFAGDAEFELCEGGCPGEDQVDCRQNPIGITLEQGTSYTLSLSGAYSIRVNLKQP